MHTYLRVLRAAGPETYSAEEEQQLRDCLAAAPGVDQVTRIERHVRGGYAVTLERRDESVDDFADWIDSAGYRVVM